MEGEKMKRIDMPTVELVAYTSHPVEHVGRAGGICYDKEEKEDYGSFVRGIVKRGHDSVIEHANFTFKVTGVSRALTHQWVRHRLCSFSQRSQRYCKEDGFDYIMPPMEYLSDEIDVPIPDGTISKCSKAKVVLSEAIVMSQKMYNDLIGLGVKPEDARFVLPNACETRMVWTVNARELRHFLELRMDSHAQWEIRRMAHLMWDQVVAVAPELFDDLWGLRGKYKEECPQYEYKPTDVNIPQKSDHWCSHKGEWIESCPMICPKFNEFMFESEEKWR